jgi:hypothetical protein
MSLRLVRDNLGGSDDTVLWELISDSGAGGDDLLIASPGRQPPAGFRVSVPFSDPLPSDRVLTIAVHHSREPMLASSFQLGELREGQVLSDIHTYLSRSEYLALAKDTCDNRLDDA